VIWTQDIHSKGYACSPTDIPNTYAKCNPTHMGCNPWDMHPFDTYMGYEMHSNRYGIFGPEMGSYVLDNTSSVMGISLGVHILISLDIPWSACM